MIPKKIWQKPFSMCSMEIRLFCPAGTYGKWRIEILLPRSSTTCRWYLRPKTDCQKSKADWIPTGILYAACPLVFASPLAKTWFQSYQAYLHRLWEENNRRIHPQLFPLLSFASATKPQRNFARRNSFPYNAQKFNQKLVRGKTEINLKQEW